MPQILTSFGGETKLGLIETPWSCQRFHSTASPLRLILAPPVGDDELARYLQVADQLRP